MNPKAARETNQMTITGPNANATRSDPRAWRVKRPMAINAAMTIRTTCEVLSYPGNEEDAFDGREDTDRRGDHAVPDK